METTTSAARTISSVQGLGYSLEMSMPRSAIAAIAAGLTWTPGSVPPDQAMAASPAWWVKNPSAIWERPALWVHRNSTTGVPVFALPSTLASAVRRWRANRSAEQREEVGDGGAVGELVVGGGQEPFDGLGVEGAGELGREPGRSGLQGELLVEA